MRLFTFKNLLLLVLCCFFFSANTFAAKKKKAKSQYEKPNIIKRAWGDVTTRNNMYFNASELYKEIKCEHCHGNMAEPGTPINSCKTCNGSGVVIQMQRTFIGAFQTQATCPDCHGEGKKAEKKCTKCDGLGITKQKEVVVVDIPAGVENGMTLRVSGKGNAGKHGGSNGDLYVRVRVKEDERFQRFGDDLLSKEKIDFTQAILGTKLDIETLDGAVELKIPEGTQPNTRFRLKNKGLGHLNSSGRGDMYVEVEVVIPKSISRKQRQLLEGFDD